MGNTRRTLEDLYEKTIFWSRWVQAPIYSGLSIASVFYALKFFQELYHLSFHFTEMGEIDVMLVVLALVDISMVLNLLVMVIIGGYSIFTSKINLDNHEDKPLWLEGLDAGKLKIKLASSLASISGVHLLKTFIDVRSAEESEGFEGIMVEIAIHLTFIVSSWLLAHTERIQHSYHHEPPGSEKSEGAHQGDPSSEEGHK
ncbi:MAG: TIGR00645 family protein [Cytophagales bacterium]|nr:TIGR00645 family protein [Cytophagales bacterium]